MSKKDKELKFQRFGRYLLLDHIVDGGMAKIWRARFLGEQANKLVAIKMIQAQFTEDAAFRQMFEDEIKLAFSLIHPSIAQTYDYGIVDGQLFTAMEYVDGANLKQYMDRLKKRNFVFPIEISSYIISQACQGLHYAHTYTDKLSGKALNIIHRDISPHNIMLTYDGSVKVIDFGIAKAETNSEQTQAGTIKGKLAYLAPEYLDGLDLDCRYDVFALGITFWELLCNRRLFSASNDLAILKKIQNCEIPAPSSINPNIPKELDEIVLKALAKDRNDRFENMDKFNRAIVRFLYAKYPEFNATDLSYFANELFKEDIASDRKKFVRFGQIDIKPYLQEMKEDLAHPGLRNGGTPVESKGGAQRKERVELDFSSVEETQIDLSERVNHTRTRNYGTVIQKNKTRTSISRTGIRRGTQVAKAPKKSSSGKNLSYMAIAACLVLVLAFKMGILGDKEVVAQVEKGQQVKQTKKTLVYLDGFQPLMRIYINDEEVEYSDFSGLKIPADQEVKITIKELGKVPYTTHVTFGEQDSGESILIPTLTADEYGLLTTSRNFPQGAKLQFSIRGSQVEKELPVDNMRVPAGSYEAIIIDPILKTKKKVNFKIEPSKKFFLRK